MSKIVRRDNTRRRVKEERAESIPSSMPFVRLRHLFAWTRNRKTSPVCLYLVLVQEFLVNEPGRTLDHLVNPLAVAYTFVSLLVGHDSLAFAAVGHLVIAHYLQR
jgi:hypothetical protein